jgi:hypothetical protein
VQTATALWLALSTAHALHAQDGSLVGRWSIALELGELPMHGSFKPGIAVGYHLDDRAWIGFVFQAADSIHRGDSSFNAGSTALDGLTGSGEHVGRRAYLQARLRPHRWAPYVSVGVVYNARDTETITFDDRVRSLGGATARGPLRVRISRPAGVRPALGAGYGWTSDAGLSAFVEWSGWWMFGAPRPELDITGADSSPAFTTSLERRITDHFTGSPFNSYHLFQVGVGWTH